MTDQPVHACPVTGTAADVQRLVDVDQGCVATRTPQGRFHGPSEIRETTKISQQQILYLLLPLPNPAVERDEGE